MAYFSNVAMIMDFREACELTIWSERRMQSSQKFGLCITLESCNYSGGDMPFVLYYIMKGQRFAFGDGWTISLILGYGYSCH